jgi:rare lipoprotein A
MARHRGASVGDFLPRAKIRNNRGDLRGGYRERIIARMQWRAVVVVGVCVAFGAGCSLVRPKHAPPPSTGSVQVGLASWYGPGFHGKRTASGEVYNQGDLTAAHRTLPLGTRVKVTSLTNGRTVEVRINDRGPFVGNRVIDLSEAAARRLQMIGPGTMRVRGDPLGRGTSLGRDDLHARYVVQIGTFGDEARARALRDQLASRFPEAHLSRLVTSSGRYVRVRLGPYDTRRTADARAAVVDRLGYPTVVMEAPPSYAATLVSDDGRR